MRVQAALTKTDTGEPGAVKIACPVRRGDAGKGPDYLGHLAGVLPSGEIDVTEYERLRDALQGTLEESPAGEVHTHVERLGD